LLAAALLMPAPVAGQTVGTATGSIVGTVTDGTGAVLAGVSVTAVSPALMGSRTTVTSAEGRYRIAALPPGEYHISFALDGFRTSQLNAVRLTVGSTATLDVVLALATMEEGVTVTARRAVLDRQSTAVSYTYDARQIADLPIGRGMDALVAATPGVDTGDWLAYGTRGMNRPTVEGILVSGIRATPFELDDGSFAEVAAATAAHGPMVATPGVQLQFLSKSGGNLYRGTVYAEHQDSRWQSSNIDASQIERGVDADRGRWRQHDLNANIGGFIVRDRLWWYTSFRDQESAQRLVNFHAGPHRTRLANYTGKATYRLSPANTFTAYGQLGRSHQPNRLDAFHVSTSIHESEASTANERGLGWVLKGEWNIDLSDSLRVEVRAGQFGTETELTPHSLVPRYEDATTFEVRGGSREWSREFIRKQLFATASHFHDGRTGTHHVKAGIDVLHLVEGETWRQGFPGNVLHVLSNGVPNQVYFFDTPSHSESGLWTFAVHAADTWQVSDRLTLNAGVRFDRNRVFLPAQSHPAGNPAGVQFAAVDNLISWNTLVPRLGAVYSLTRSSDTLIKAAYGRYRLGVATGSNSNPNSPVRWSRSTWTDFNGDGAWQPGENSPPGASRGGQALESIDPRMQLPLLDEVVLSLERQLRGSVALRTAGVWRGERQHFARYNANWPFDAFTLATVAQDPGPDGRLATADDGPGLSALTLPPDLAKLRSPNVVRNVPGSASEYWTWEIGASRQFRGRWSLNAAFTHTWHRDQAAGYAGQTVRNNRFPLTPNDLINTRGFGGHAFTTWTAKAHATYTAPHDIRITPIVQHYSGQPFGRVFQTDLGYGTVTVLAEPIGARRMDHITIADVRVEKGIRLRGNRRVAGFVDVLNLFNSNAETSISWMSGPGFLQPLGIVAPRTVKVGLKFDW
jgi:hypothetical protein